MPGRIYDHSHSQYIYICIYIYKCIRSHLWLKSQAETDLFSDCASPAPANSGLPQLLSPP